MNMRFLLPCCLALTLLLARPALGHDFWLQLSTYAADVGEAVGAGLRVGHEDDVAVHPRQPDRVVKFVALDPGGEETDLPGPAGAEPAGVVTPTRPGYHVVGYRSNDATSTLPGDQFDGYLAGKGLDQIVALRADRGESDEPGIELYSRACKALLHVAGAAEAQDESRDEARDDGWKRRLDFRLELSPDADPRSVAGGRDLPLVLEFEGGPLADARVEARPLGGVDAAERTVSGRTDAEGRVRLPLAGGGEVWLVTAVHVVEAPTNDEGADWQSVWASLTLAVGTPPADGE